MGDSAGICDQLQRGHQKADEHAAVNCSTVAASPYRRKSSLFERDRHYEARSWNLHAAGILPHVPRMRNNYCHESSSWLRLALASYKALTSDNRPSGHCLIMTDLRSRYSPVISVIAVMFLNGHARERRCMNPFDCQGSKGTYPIRPFDRIGLGHNLAICQQRFRNLRCV